MPRGSLAAPGGLASPDRIRAALQDVRGGARVQSPEAEDQYRALDKYTKDLTQLAKQGKNPLQLDSKEPKIDFKQYAYMQTRFKMLTRSKPEEAERLIQLAQQDAATKWHLYQQLSQLTVLGAAGGNGSPVAAPAAAETVKQS